jgi:hypothetical protein
MKYTWDSEESIDLILADVVAHVTLIAPRCASAMIPVPNLILMASSFLIAMWYWLS